MRNRKTIKKNSIQNGLVSLFVPYILTEPYILLSPWSIAIVFHVRSSFNRKFQRVPVRNSHFWPCRWILRYILERNRLKNLLPRSPLDCVERRLWTCTGIFWRFFFKFQCIPEIHEGISLILFREKLTRDPRGRHSRCSAPTAVFHWNQASFVVVMIWRKNVIWRKLLIRRKIYLTSSWA